jgi:hypothetical protein
MCSVWVHESLSSPLAVWFELPDDDPNERDLGRGPFVLPFGESWLRE